MVVSSWCGSHGGGDGAVHAGRHAGQADGDRCRPERGIDRRRKHAPGGSRSARDAEFYGAMDGAARFNQRDSLATILITAINIVAGFLIGVFQLEFPFREALKTYTILTVGDGLVTLIPSLLVSSPVEWSLPAPPPTGRFRFGGGQQLLSRQPASAHRHRRDASLASIPGLPKFSFLPLAAGRACRPARIQGLRRGAGHDVRCPHREPPRIRGRIFSNSMNSASRSDTDWSPGRC